MNNPLSALRDIHLPEQVGWWPLAPVWWLLVAGFLLALIAGLWWWRRLRLRQAPVRAALLELNGLETRYRENRDATLALQEFSVLLRRVALTLRPRTEVASLDGEEWLQQLDSLAGGTYFHTSLGRSLLQAPYQAVPEVDPGPLLKLGRDWLEGLGRHV